jgi:hypothetical protein
MIASFTTVLLDFDAKRETAPPPFPFHSISTAGGTTPPLPPFPSV